MGAFISQLKLSLQGWALITLTVAVGALVALLRLQGSKLHAAEVALLAAQLKARQDQDDAKVADAMKRYIEAKRAYEEGR
jgi:hypothetical protein